VQGTAILLDILVNKPHKVTKIVYASSRAIYGEGKYLSETLGVIYPGHRKDADMEAGIFELLSPDTGAPMQILPTTEDSKLQPSSVYGHTKLVQEQMLMLIGKQLSIPVVALRFQNVYGPGQSLANPYTGLLAVFSNNTLYTSVYFFLVFLFTYFYTAVTFDPDAISKNLQQSGAFIPGVRPGQSTADHIGNILTRLTMFGALFLGIIAIMPGIVDLINRLIFLAETTGNAGNAALVLGGSALIIVVGVVIDTMRQLESQLMMRNYEGFMN
jgi:hypothetical protein